MVFVFIAGVLLTLNVAQVWLNQTLKVRLRAGLTRDLFGEWLKPKRAFRLAGAGEIGENPDQRIHEDARHLTELSTDLGIGLLQSTLLLISFVGVLWILSPGHRPQDRRHADLDPRLHGAGAPCSTPPPPLG